MQHQIWVDERLDELSNSYVISESHSTSPCENPQHHHRSTPQIVDGASLIRAVVEDDILPASSEIKEFDGAVEIIDSVMVDHVSEDDKSTSSEEVTYERWTEETRLRRTRIFDENGHMIDEYVQQLRPSELVGDIVRERLIERHEHMKRVSKNVLRRIKVKSLSSLDEDQDNNNTSNNSSTNKSRNNEENNEDDVIIVEPQDTRRLQDDSTYFIQHQQVIKPPTSGDLGDEAICAQNCVRIIADPFSAAPGGSIAASSSSSSASPNNSALAASFNLFSAASASASNENSGNNNNENNFTTNNTNMLSSLPNDKPPSKFSLDLINAVLNMSIKENRATPPNLSSLLRNFCLIIIAFLF